MPESKKRSRNELSPNAPPLMDEKNATESVPIKEGVGANKEGGQNLQNVRQRNLSTNDFSHSEIPPEQCRYIQRDDKPSNGSTVGCEKSAAKLGAVSSQFQKNYIKLQDAALKDKAIVSVFGVVVSFQVSPKTCSGTHKYSCTYALADPSNPSLQYPVVLQVFSSNLKEFPTCIRAGDVMRCKNVKVDVFNNFPKLIGSDRNKSSFVTFSKTIDHLTGFSRRQPQACSSAGIDMNWGLPPMWTVRSTDRKARGDPDTTLKVTELSTWSDKRFLEASVGEKSIWVLTLNEVLSHTKLIDPRAASRNQSDKGGKCDVICMVAAVLPEGSGAIDHVTEGSGGKGTVMLLWDGSTDGNLANMGGSISVRNFKDVSKSLHSAMLFSKIADETKWEDLSELRDQIESPSLAPECLQGNILAVSSMKGDQHTSTILNGLRSGMWLRLRNLHIDRQTEEIAYSTTLSGTGATSTSSSSSSSSTTLLSTTECTTAPSLLSSATSARSGPHRVNWVGEVHADTHISLLLPYYCDVGRCASAYRAKHCDPPKRNVSAVDLSTTAPPPVLSHSSPAKPIINFHNANGVPYTNLLQCFSKPAPNAFRTLAHIVDYKPRDIGRFVCKRPASVDDDNQKKSTSASEFLFRFCLRITDDMMEADVLMFDQVAEKFLGVTADEFHSSEAARVRAEERLHSYCVVMKDGQRRLLTKAGVMELIVLSFFGDALVNGVSTRQKRLMVADVMPAHSSRSDSSSILTTSDGEEGRDVPLVPFSIEVPSVPMLAQQSLPDDKLFCHPMRGSTI